ncbi:MAG: DNA cytosine methyltransferase [Sinobacteraceae bacterium]|nr:DNA cytosine methyltransferase [Nevskiaceae bacterium]
MATIINTVLGQHRGHKRLWLEGQKLVREGYAVGTPYSVEFKTDRMVITAHEADDKTGQYRVSRRRRNGHTSPIIDIEAREMATLFDGIEKLRVAIHAGRIVVTAHHQQQRVNQRIDRLVNRLSSHKPLSVCSLFHGGGVLDKAIHHGMMRVGVKTRIGVAVEMEPKYLDASLRNNPELWDEASVAIESRIQDVALGKSPPPVDILVGGIPCTGASKSGRSKNKLAFAESHSEAGAMFFQFLQFVQVLNPSVVIIENVPEYQNTASMVVIRSVLDTLGYDIQECILEGNAFGVLERRKRLCAVALSKGMKGFVLDRVMPVKNKEAHMADILDPVTLDSSRWKAFDYLAAKQERDAAAGKGFTRQLLTGAEEGCGTIGKGYAKCRSTEPFIVHPQDPGKSRILTPAEHCRVKGIPASVTDGLSETTAHEILGQSVIYPAFEAVAASLGQFLQGLTKTAVPLAA